MGFIEAVKTCFSKYFDFKGRARRSEYWWFYLFTLIGSIITSVLDAIIFGLEVGLINIVFTLAVMIPTLSAAARRLHDTNRSGWWQIFPLVSILFLIPGILMATVNGGSPPGGLSIALIVIGFIAMLVAAIFLIVWLATDGHESDNRFGVSPKYGSIYNTFS